KQAQSRVKALERMERIAPALTAADFQFEFKEPASIPNPMLSIQDAALGYATGHGPLPILQGVSRSVMAGQRIGILGANGQGKSTFVKTVAKQLEPLGGKFTEGKGLSIGYFAQQELDVLHEASTPLEHMIRLAKDVGPPGREQELRNFLGGFLFTGEMVGQAVGSMSGGEKARLVLAMVVWQRPNLLLLDEPTNHLDLTTREALQMALNEFEGTVMLVSHDRALLRSVCDEFWLVGCGVVKPFDGDLDDYQKYLLEQAKLRREGLDSAQPAVSAENQNTIKSIALYADSMTTISPKGIKNESAAPFKSKEQKQEEARQRIAMAEKTKPLKARLTQLENSIAALHAEQTALHEQLMQALPAPQLIEANKRLAVIAQEIEDAEWKWLELSERIDGLLTA
ncbi:MAG: ABC-F family ATP-binding cassette domain-containing protein, partial [Brachymonas sp.]